MCQRIPLHPASHREMYCHQLGIGADWIPTLLKGENQSKLEQSELWGQKQLNQALQHVSVTHTLCATRDQEWEIIHLLVINGHSEFVTTGICLCSNCHTEHLPRGKANKLLGCLGLYSRIYKALLLHPGFRQDIPGTRFDANLKKTNKPTTRPHTGSKANKTSIHPPLYESQFRSWSYMARERFGKTKPEPRRFQKKKKKKNYSELFSASSTQLSWDCQKRAEETQTNARGPDKPSPHHKHNLALEITLTSSTQWKREQIFC